MRARIEEVRDITMRCWERLDGVGNGLRQMEKRASSKGIDAHVLPKMLSDYGAFLNDVSQDLKEVYAFLDDAHKLLNATE